MSSRRTLSRALVCLLSALVLSLSMMQPSSASAAPPAPSGLTPNGTNHSAVPTLRWTRVPAAAHYDVEISAPDLTPIQASTVNRRYTPTVQLPASSISWRVRAVTVAGVRSAWSSATFERIAPPGPTPQAHIGEPRVLTWSPVTNASDYEVEIDDDPGFATPTAGTTRTTTYVAPSPQPYKDYFWRVRATIGDALQSEWSATGTYKADGLIEVDPQLPTDGSSVEDIVFDWALAPGARGYELRVSADPNFTTLVPDGEVVVIRGTRYSPPVTFDNGEYWWQVRARNAAGNTIPWTDTDRVPVRHFMRTWTETPQLQSPAEGTAAPVGDPFVFQWKPVDHASRYQLQMGTDPAFSAGTFETCETRATTLTPGVLAPSNLANPLCTPRPGVINHWRVRALDEPYGTNGVVGAWSGTRSFVYEPDRVILDAPLDGATVAVPTLRWRAARDAERYRVVVRDDEDTVVAQTTTSALSWTPLVRLGPPRSTYSWFVTSIDANGHESPPTSAALRTFTVDGEPPTTGARPLTPLNSPLTSARPPSLQWEPYPGAAYYWVTVADRVEGGAVVTVETEYTALSEMSAALLARGTYNWYVRAYDETGRFLGMSTSIGELRIVDVSAATGQQVALIASDIASNPCDNSLSAPGDEQSCDDLIQTPVLDWHSVPGASHYRLHLFHDRQMTRPVYPESTYITTQNTRWTPPQLLADSSDGAAYYWFVQPCKAVDVCAPAPTSASHSFSKRSLPVDLVSPADDAVVGDQLRLEWQGNLENLEEAQNGQVLEDGATATNATVEAQQYRVQISDDESFATVLASEVVDQTTYTPFTLNLPARALFWRVQTVDGSGNALPWSEVRSVVKGPPRVVPLAPDDGGVVQNTPFFSWQPLEAAVSYQLEITDSSDTVVLHSAEQAAYALAAPLPTSGSEYWWRVRPLDANGTPGPWSERRRFTLSGDAPVLDSPAAGALVQGSDSDFSWQSGPTATTYRFERRRAGSSSRIPTRTYATAWAPTSALSTGRWEWRVTSLDAIEQPIASSDWRPLVADSTRPRITSRRPAPAPRPGRNANWVVTFSEPVKGVSSRTMRLYRQGSSAPVRARITSSNGGRTRTLNPSAPMRQRTNYTLRMTSGITDRVGNSAAASSYTRRVR